MQKFTLKLVFLSLVFSGWQVEAGTVLDDLFNLASAGEYHRSYEREKARVERDIAELERSFQAAKSQLALQTNLNFAAIFKRKHDLVQLNLQKANIVVASSAEILELIKQALASKLKADRDLKLQISESEDLKMTYEALSKHESIAQDKDYFQNLQASWLSSMEELSSLSANREKTTTLVLTEQFEALDKTSLEHLLASITGLNESMTMLQGFFRAELRRNAEQHNSHLNAARALGNTDGFTDLPIE